MKIDKTNPAHWLYLTLFALNVLLALCLRRFLSVPPKPLVLLYGHKLNGNLKSLYDDLRSLDDPPCTIAFLTMDPAYYRELAAGQHSVFLAIAPRAIVALAAARCIVSDHGLHVMSWLPRLTSIRFADVWHGIPFKGWDADDFRVLHFYDAIWVSSELVRRFYTERFGFGTDQVHVTGYGRTDALINGCTDLAHTRQSIGAPPAPTKLILFAPTWQHGIDDRSVFPFGTEAPKFFETLDEICRAHNAVCLFRTHLNTRIPQPPASGSFRFVPQDLYPDTEAVLAMSDILVCDWSSIAFDYLLLDRPTIFLDVPAPFPKGFSLGPEYRFGAVAPSMRALCVHLETYLSAPERYHHDHGTRAAGIKRAVYDDCADGHAASRYRKQLLALITSD
jgi:CDP-glycerol glycerophosphotransferase (TagB/SpsB family)